MEIQPTATADVALAENIFQRAFAAAKCTVTGRHFDEAVCEVWRSLQAKDVDYNAVERVVSAHLDLQQDPRYPELNFDKLRSREQINANNFYINAVAQAAGVSVSLAFNALERLYWASLDGKIPNQRTLFPRRFAKEGDVRNDENPVWTYVKIGGFVVVGVGVCVAAWYGAKAYREIKTANAASA